ncbi:MAG TPA: glycosyltransferase family 4 protein [Thermoanaerobaculia bacterium]|nr:glycosyltransferase family 4 protein [Thermoanaerobaculia bacterium]
MHIAYLHYLQEDDTALYHVRQFAQAAGDLGHRVDVHAIRTPRTDSVGSGQQRAAWRGSLRAGIGRALHEPKELASSFVYHFREMRCLRNCRPDVLLVRNKSLTASFLWTAARTRRPLTIEINAPRVEALLYDRDHFHVPFIPDWLQALKLRRADSVVTVSSALRDHLIERHRIDHERFVVTPNGADVDLFSPGINPDAEILAEFGDAPVVGFVGSFSRWHGVDLLAEMTRRIAERRPEARFVYVGSGPEVDALTAASAGLEPRLRMLGRVPHERIPALVATFAVAVMPDSNFYGSPLKVVEWMAAGRPIVAPAYGPLLEIIESGKDGLLFEPGRIDALVSAVTGLLDNVDLRGRLGRNAAERARRELTWTHNAQRVLRACSNAIERHARL